MPEPDLTFEMSTKCFAWPAEVVLTRPDGISLRLSPHKSLPVAINKLDHSIAGRNASYRSGAQILDELDVLIWHSGKTHCDDVAELVGGLFDSCNEEKLKTDFVIRDLIIRGFLELEINLNLRWMIRSGKLAIESTRSGQYFRMLY